MSVTNLYGNPKSNFGQSATEVGFGVSAVIHYQLPAAQEVLLRTNS